MKKPLYLGALLLSLTACGADSNGEDTNTVATNTGKGDQVESSCTSEHNAWLLNDFAPLLCEDGPTCVGRVSLDTRPTCQGEPDYDTWTLVWDKHIFVPIMLRRNAALDAFMLRESPHFLDREQFITDTAPTQDELRAHRALLEIPRYVEAFDFDMWIGRYETLLGDFAFPLYSQANTLSVGNGRNVCLDPFSFEESEYNCEHEPTLFLNESEKATLALFESFRPEAGSDGPFAAWTGVYFSFLAGSTTADLLHFQFPFATENGLAGYELEFFGRLRNVAPKAEGEADSEGWMGRYTMLLSTAHLSDSDQSLQLDLFEVTRPAQLVGLPAYESWLGTDILESGFLEVSNDSEKLDRLLAVKPCARDAEELASLQSVFDGFETNVETADLELAAPAVCGSAQR